ncbi:MAG: hypothetical protein NTX53_21290 [candidate division WOR-3 bacterium]|nr:hypothetical protein [candidate division WOR-3 bacterium]
MTESKKEWHKPELTVVVRGKPEEAVLGGCKTVGPSAGPTVGEQFCIYPDTCPLCNADTPS